MQLERSNRTKLHVDAQKLMPYLCQDTQASFSPILTLILVAVIIATSYWCSRCCHTFVPLQVTLTYSSETVQQRIVRVRRSNSFSVKLRNSLLQTYGLQNSFDLNPVDYRIWDVMQDCVYQMPVWDVADLKQRLTDTWNGLSQSIVDDAVDE